MVSKGFVLLAQNTDSVDYVQQAYALALSIKFSQPLINSVTLVTGDDVPLEYQHVFDKIIPIPWGDQSQDSRYRTENRWKLIYASPYDETIVLDTDMLLLEDISKWWEYCSNYNIKYCSRIKNYKLETVIDKFHRKTFIANNLTNPYCALHYFKKSTEAFNFYKVLEFVCNNWEWCWTIFASKEYQPWLSMDLAVAIAIEITGYHEQIIDSCCPFEFIHMKVPLQNWTIQPDSWKDNVFYSLNSKGDLVVGNIKQSKLFHYIEDDFLNSNVIQSLERLVQHGR